MTDQVADGAPPIRPYFVPEGIDFETLPKAVQLAFSQVVSPVYVDLVLGAKSSLERSAGVTLVFLLAQELLDHFALGRAMDFAQAQQDSVEREEQDKKIRRYLRLISSKQAAANFLVKLQSLRSKWGNVHDFSASAS
jgi:hypothetical protein